MKRILLIMMSVLILSSCATLKNMSTVPVLRDAEPGLSEAWKGQPYSEIVLAFGAPTRSASDGRGGIIYVYEEIDTKYSTSTSSLNTGTGVDSETTVETKRKFTEFYVDSDGICYHVRSNRQEPTGEVRFSPLKAITYYGATGVMLVTMCELLSIML